MGTKKESGRMKWLLVVVLVLGMSTLGYCFFAFPTYSWNQKMTIEIEADGQVYTGSSVVRVSWRKNSSFGEVHGPSWLSGIRGEAAFVEIPGPGVLFALLSISGNTSYTADLPTRIMTGRKKGWARGEEEFAAVEAAKGQILTVTELHYPLLITFTDITDPKTVKKIDPANLASSLGPGVLLKRITLEITDEPVTEGKVERVLGWWLAQGTDRRDPPPFRLPNDSPRGYETIGVTKFITR